MQSISCRQVQGIQEDDTIGTQVADILEDEEARCTLVFMFS